MLKSRNPDVISCVEPGLVGGEPLCDCQLSLEGIIVTFVEDGKVVGSRGRRALVPKLPEYFASLVTFS